MSNINITKLAKIHSILSAARERGSSHAEEIQVYSKGYAEPGYSDPESGLIAVGNWNDDDVRGPQGYTKDGRDIPGRLENILSKRYGCEIEWCDEWCDCGKCGKLVRTHADSYQWKRSYIENDGEILCRECILGDEEETRSYLEGLEGDENKAITLEVDPEKFGYVRILEDLENGLYGGQSADPKVIAQSLRTKEVNRFIFRIDSCGQFDLKFSVFVHEDEVKQANDGPIETNAALDPAVALERGLRAAAAEYGTPVAGAIKIATIHGDGTATVKTLTPEQFIQGGAK